MLVVAMPCQVSLSLSLSLSFLPFPGHSSRARPICKMTLRIRSDGCRPDVLERDLAGFGEGARAPRSLLPRSLALSQPLSPPELF